MTTRTLVLFLTLVAWTGPLLLGKNLKVGQQWEFTGRAADPHPTLVIVRIEQPPNLGEVVHISASGVHINNPRSPSGYSDNVPHMPFSRAAVEGSIKRLVSDSVALPHFEEGYAAWQAAHGGVFSISVREALDFIERGLK